jgi:hypothetical protein
VVTKSDPTITVFWDAEPVVWQTLTDVSEVLTASIIALMMEAANTSGTSVNFYRTTWRNLSEESHLHTLRLENLKSHITGIYQNTIRKQTILCGLWSSGT